MKWVIVVLGILLLLIGTLWILQGYGIYPVGGMAYQVKWAYAGVVLDLAGIGLFILGNRRKK